MKVQIELKGIEQLEVLLDKISARGHNLDPVFHSMGNKITTGIEESFDNEKSYDGTSWKALADATVAYKEKYGGSKILQSADKNLYESIGFQADSNSLAVGVNAYSEDGYPYPLVHQFGSEDGKIPARPFIPIDDNGDLYMGVKNELIDLLEDFLAGA